MTGKALFSQLYLSISRTVTLESRWSKQLLPRISAIIRFDANERKKNVPDIFDYRTVTKTVPNQESKLRWIKTRTNWQVSKIYIHILRVQCFIFILYYYWDTRTSSRSRQVLCLRIQWRRQMLLDGYPPLINIFPLVII